jgi:hypothetical protein
MKNGQLESFFGKPYKWGAPRLDGWINNGKKQFIP